MVKENCPNCGITLVPISPPENLKDFPDEVFECSKCHKHYRIPYKGQIIKIGAEPSADLFVSSSLFSKKPELSLHFSRSPIFIKLFQFCTDYCFADLGTVSA
jgi:hypothetical protein